MPSSVPQPAQTRLPLCRAPQVKSNLAKTAVVDALKASMANAGVTVTDLKVTGSGGGGGGGAVAGIIIALILVLGLVAAVVWYKKKKPAPEGGVTVSKADVRQEQDAI